jgi:hypothetical protein
VGAAVALLLAFGMAGALITGFGFEQTQMGRLFWICLLASLVSAVCLIYFSCFLFFNEDFLLSYFVIHLPLLSQILAVLLLTFTIIRACRRKKFVLLLISSLFCLTWPIMQFVYMSAFFVLSLFFP